MIGSRPRLSSTVKVIRPEQAGGLVTNAMTSGTVGAMFWNRAVWVLGMLSVACAPSAAAPPPPVIVATAPPRTSEPSPSPSPPPAPAAIAVDAGKETDEQIAERCQIAMTAPIALPPECHFLVTDLPPVDLSTTARDVGVRLDGGALRSAPSAPTAPLMGTVARVALDTKPPMRDAARIAKALEPKFRNCYRKGLEVDPSMKGEIAFRVSVAANGEVGDTQETGGSGLDANVGRCVARALRNAMFDAPGGSGSILTIKLRFAP
jgi:hypothetical protein